MPKFYDIDLEKKVINAMLHNEEALDYANTHITSIDFESNDTSKLFEICIKFYQKYYKPISREILNTWLQKNDKKYKTTIMLLFAEIEALPIDSYYRYYINELKSFTAKRQLYKIHDTLTTGLNDDINPEELYTNISREILTTNTSSIVYRTSVFDNIDDRIKLYEDKRDNPEKYRGLQYGIEEIDALTGGMYKGQLYMIIGRTGAGKSRSLFNIGANVAKRGKSVMYCTIEMEAAIIQQMWESRESRIPLQNILRANMGPMEPQYIKFLKESVDTKIPFYIVDIPQGCTTGMIDAEVATFEKVHGKVPDIVLIDYANLINPVSKFKDRPEKYDHVFRELKEGSRAHKTVYYTAAQMNRESLKSKEPGTEHVSFSDAASYHCDAIFRVFADKNSEENKEINFEVIKGRYHGKASINLCWLRDINLICSWGKEGTGITLPTGNQNGSNSTDTKESESDTFEFEKSENSAEY